MHKIILALGLSLLAFFSFSQQNKQRLFIGTYTNSCESDGVYVYDFDAITADVTLVTSTKKIVNPSFLSLSADKKYLYIVNEAGENSKVSSFRYSNKNGTLDLLNQVDAQGKDPCFLLNDQQNIITANYSSGTIAVFSKNEDESIGNLKIIVKEESDVNNKNASHIHKVEISPDKHYVLATDLGKDYLYVYQYQPNKKNEVLQLRNAIKVDKNAGPRHFCFGARGKNVYVINEYSGGVNVYSYRNGNLKLQQKTSIVAKDFQGNTSAADIQISSDGKFLYATNRGDANTISCFAIKRNGTLQLVETKSTLGNGPRNFTIDPSGKFLLVAHQYSNEVVIFKIDRKTGMLTDSGKRIALCSPVCLVFE